MAVNQPPMFIEGGCYTADDFRGLAAAAGHGTEGITRGLLTTVASGTRDVTVAPGEAVVLSEDESAGSYVVKVTDPEVLTIAPGASSGGSRIDLIVARVQSVAAGDGVDAASVEVVSGTAGGSAPSPPPRSVTIATVTVPQAADVITDANVKGAPNVNLYGHLPVFASTAVRDAAIPDPLVGQRCIVSGDMWVMYAGGWAAPQTYRHTVTLTTTGGALSSAGKLATGTITIPARPYPRIVSATAQMLLSISGAGMDVYIVVGGVKQKRMRSVGTSLTSRFVAHDFEVAAGTATTINMHLAAITGTSTLGVGGSSDLNWMTAVESPTKL